jgi:hypothetical protein
MAKTAKQESEKKKKRKERRERTTHRRETVKYSRVAIVPSERHGALGMKYYWNIHMHLLGVYSISLSQVSPLALHLRGSWRRGISWVVL